MSEEKKQSKKTSTSTQLAMIIGAAVLLVVALYLVTDISKQALSPQSPIEGETAVEEGLNGEPSADRSVVEEHADVPLSESIAPQADSLEAVIEGSEGEERRTAQQELVDLFVGAGRVDRAAILQHELAEELDTAEAWRRSGDYYYEWMAGIEDDNAAEVAELAVASYEQALRHDPDDLDMRADMATAYLETNEPMRGVEEIQAVLEEDPNHLQARFNYGIMLSMIGRTEEAIEQFEAVQDIVGEESPFYEQANQIIGAIEEQR